MNSLFSSLSIAMILVTLVVGISRPLQALVGVLLVVAGVAAYELPGMRAARAASSEESA